MPYKDKDEGLTGTLRDLLNSMAEKSKAEPKILTCPQGVVTYIHRPIQRDLGEALVNMNSLLTTGETSVASKIKEILAANPKADLKSFEDILGVTFLDIQLKGRDSTEGTIPIGEPY